MARRAPRSARAARTSRGRRVPELVSLCGSTLYVTEYDDDAKPGGARRFTDREVVASYESLAGELFSLGVELESYFDREVAPLPKPLGAKPVS